MDVQYIASTMNDEGYYITALVGAMQLYQEGAPGSVDILSTNAKARQLNNARMFTARESSRTHWFPQGIESTFYASTEHVAGIGEDEFRGWHQTNTVLCSNTEDQVRLPSIFFGCTGCEANADVFTVTFYTVYEVIPRMSSLTPGNISPADGEELDQATNIVAMLPPARSLTNVADPVNQVYKRAAQAATHLYNPNVHRKAAKSGRSFFDRAKKWLKGVDWGNVAKSVSEIVPLVL